MKQHLTQRLVDAAKEIDRNYEVWDDDPPGLVLRVLTSGYKSYNCRAHGQQRSIGGANVYSLKQARAIAKQWITQGFPVEEKPAAKTSLRRFVTEVYGPWLLTHRKDGKASLERILRTWQGLLDTSLDDLTALDVTAWQTQRLKEGVWATTVNRDLTALRGCLSRAVEWGMLESSPLTRVRNLKAGAKREGRAMTWDEERAVREALGETDFGKMVLLSLNTGLRQGELFRIERKDIENNALTIRAEITKTGKGRRVPLNTEAMSCLPDRAGLLFPSRTGGVRDNVTKPWQSLLRKTGIVDLHWHDLRHTFVTRLMEIGVSESVIAVIVGHRHPTMTARYSHAAWEVLTAAVKRLGEARRAEKGLKTDY